MVKSEIIGRVFRITTETVSGTAFTMECGNRQFLVTAKHLFENAGFPAQATISLLTGKGYQKYCVDIRYPHSPSVDIAVLISYIHISVRSARGAGAADKNTQNDPTA